MTLEFSYAFVTPSYRHDLDRCRLLCRTMDKHIQGPFTHYLVVDRRDEFMFAPMRGKNRHVLTVESLTPWWLIRLPFARRWQLSLKTLPMRNWILQQIVKLSMHTVATEDVLAFVDSDVTFIRDLDLGRLEKNGEVRLLDIPGEGGFGEHLRYNKTAGVFLKLPPSDYYGSKYIGNIITWRRENLLRLHETLENLWDKPSIQVLSSRWYLSEYILYGVYMTHVLKEDSGHFHDAQDICLNYWQPEPLSDQEIGDLLGTIEPHHVAVMFSAKAEMGTERYEQLLSNIT